MRRLFTIVGLLVVLGFFGGVAAGQKKPPNAEELGSELARAPAAARDWQNPYAGRPEAVLAGKKLFDRHCANCHSLDGRGRDEAPDLHTPIIQSAPPGVLFWFLKNGDLKDGMPSWSRLPAQRLWQLVSYLKTFAPAEEAPEKERPASAGALKNSPSRP